MAAHHDVLHKIYTDPKNVGSFGSIKRLYDAAKGLNLRITMSDVKNFLATQRDYTLHAPARINFPRRQVFALTTNYLWEVDLIDMSKYSVGNNHIKFLLVKVDVFSKQAHVIPLVNKSAPRILAAFQELIAQAGVTPRNISSDRGREFDNAPLHAYLKSLGINQYFLYDNKNGAACAERFIRTLKNRIFHYRTAYKTNRYIHVLPDLVAAYNASKHRSIGMAPQDVSSSKPDVEDQVRRKLYPADLGVAVDHAPKHKFKVGQQVRKQILRAAFTKGYARQFTDELFSVAKVLPTKPVTYKLRATNKEQTPIEGSYYDQQLQLVLRHGEVVDADADE